MKINSYSQFYENDKNEGLVAGTIMSIVEKKSAKGTPYGIVKFSDKKVNLNYFFLQKYLYQIEKNLKESESFVLTLQKDKITVKTKKKN